LRVTTCSHFRICMCTDTSASAHTKQTACQHWTRLQVSSQHNDDAQVVNTTNIAQSCFHCARLQHWIFTHHRCTHKRTHQEAGARSAETAAVQRASFDDRILSRSCWSCTAAGIVLCECECVRVFARECVYMRACCSCVCMHAGVCVCARECKCACTKILFDISTRT